MSQAFWLQEEQMKRILISVMAISMLAGVANAGISIGLQGQFSGRTFNQGDFNQTESWAGAYGAIEYNFFTLYREVTSPEGKTMTVPVSDTPLFGVEINGGKLMSLGGKDTDDTLVTNYENSGSSVAVLLKYYFPVSITSRLHLYAGCGPEVCKLEKTDNKSVKLGELTNIRIAAPIGFDYDVTEDKKMKFTTLASIQYTVSSTLNDAGTTFNYTFGVGLKRCF
jgi:hypothetical protein